MARLPGAIEMTIGGVPARTLGRPRAANPTKHVVVAVQIPEALAAELDAYCDANFLGSRANVVRKALANLLDKRRN